MKINLIAVGKKMPSWVDVGFKEYARRMPSELSLNLIEISAVKRTKNLNAQQILEREGKQILAAIPANDYVIALDVRGKSFSTEQLAKQLQMWRENARDISLLVGGPEGLSNECLNRADFKWSLSKLTFPHPLVRVIIAEQLYRAFTILSHHPYHLRKR
jgi:23S rRNA (pseudouridine1915-N3)-methyltransferase